MWGFCFSNNFLAGKMFAFLPKTRFRNQSNYIKKWLYQTTVDAIKWSESKRVKNCLSRIFFFFLFIPKLDSGFQVILWKNALNKPKWMLLNGQKVRGLRVLQHWTQPEHSLPQRIWPETFSLPLLLSFSFFTIQNKFQQLQSSRVYGMRTS